MTNDPIKRKANNARYYQNKKARIQGQSSDTEDTDDTGDFWNN